MSEASSTDPPAGAASGGEVGLPPGGSRELRPGFCAECETAVPAGARFCHACRNWLATPETGRMATPQRRLAAAVLDSLLKEGGVLGPVLWPLFLSPGPATGIVTALTVIYGLAAAVLWSRGTTPAKRLLGMTVVTEDGKPAGFFRMAFRETIAKWISTAAFGLGLLAIPSDEERRGWHDRMAGTWVLFEDED